MVVVVPEVVVEIAEVVVVGAAEVVGVTAVGELVPRPEQAPRNTATMMTDVAALIGSGYRCPEETGGLSSKGMMARQRGQDVTGISLGRWATSPSMFWELR